MADEDLTITLVAIAAVVAFIYLPLFYVFIRSMRANIALAAFARALFRIGEELSNKDDWVPAAIDRLQSIYDRSELQRKFSSAREVVEHLHYLAYAQGAAFLSFAWFYRRNEQNQSTLLAIRAELAAQDQPHTSLRGELRKLVEAVNANLDPATDSGKVALEQLANYMTSVDRTVARKRRMTTVLTVTTVLATIVSIVSLWLQFRSGVSLVPTPDGG